MEDEFYDSHSGINPIKREDKVIVLLKPVASAPILKKTKFQVSGKELFATIINFVKTQTRIQENIFLYCNNSFAPPPDAVVADLFECFKVGKELIINYAVVEAWG